MAMGVNRKKKRKPKIIGFPIRPISMPSSYQSRFKGCSTRGAKSTARMKPAERAPNTTAPAVLARQPAQAASPPKITAKNQPNLRFEGRFAGMLGVGMVKRAALDLPQGVVGARVAGRLETRPQCTS